MRIFKIELKTTLVDRWTENDVGQVFHLLYEHGALLSFDEFDMVLNVHRKHKA